MIYSYKDSYHGEQISPLFSLAGTLGIPNMYMKYTIRNYQFDCITINTGIITMRVMVIKATRKIIAKMNALRLICL